MALAMPSKTFPVLKSMTKGIARQWNDAGDRSRFYFETIYNIPLAIIKYPSEILRNVAVLGMGLGVLVTIGGSIAIVALTSMTTGSLVGVQAYNQLQATGVEALTGAASAFFNPRIIQEGTPCVTLAATIGAAATAELGAMRISEEVDALEVLGIRTIAYLASTRVIAGMIAVIPIWCGGLCAGYAASRFATVTIYGQSAGVFDHYFNLFLNTGDIIRGGGIVWGVTLIIMLIHTYRGYTASGGPAGVGEAVGKATRSSVAFASLGIVALILAIYGTNGNIHLAG